MESPTNWDGPSKASPDFAAHQPSDSTILDESSATLPSKSVREGLPVIKNGSQGPIDLQKRH